MARLRVRPTPVSLVVLCLLLLLVLSLMYSVFQYDPSFANLVVSTRTRIQSGGADIHDFFFPPRSAPLWPLSASQVHSTPARTFASPHPAPLPVLSAKLNLANVTQQRTQNDLRQINRDNEAELSIPTSSVDDWKAEEPSNRLPTSTFTRTPARPDPHPLESCSESLKKYSRDHPPTILNRRARRAQRSMCMGAPSPWLPTTDTASLSENSTSEGEDYQEDEAALGADGTSSAARHQRAILGVTLQEKDTKLRSNYCSGDQQGSAQRKFKPTPEQFLLACCLRKGGMGKQCPVDAVTLRDAALSLPSLKMLDARVACFRVTASGSCATLEGNPESNLQGHFAMHIRPDTDWREKQWKSCAIVGRSPAIKIAENGAAIDAHDAVWRFNLASTTGVEAYTGKKTTLRIVNNADAHRARDGQVGTSEKQSFKSSQSSEDWVFWQYASVRFMNAIAEVLEVDVHLLAPKFLKWQMDIYFAMKRDLERLGLGPFECPTSVSSGIHALLMGTQLCERVDTFGYSYYNKMFTSKDGHNNGPQKMYRGHSWRLDMTILRLLAVSGRTWICTADNPNISMAELQQRGESRLHKIVERPVEHRYSSRGTGGTVPPLPASRNGPRGPYISESDRGNDISVSSSASYNRNNAGGTRTKSKLSSSLS